MHPPPSSSSSAPSTLAPRYPPPSRSLDLKPPPSLSQSENLSRGALAGRAWQGTGVPEVLHLGWGRWYTLKELVDATCTCTDAKVIGGGGYDIVYHGVLKGGVQVTVKNLLNNRGQAEREFKVEVEAIGRVRHKNLVRLLGYCMKATKACLCMSTLITETWSNGSMVMLVM